MYTHQQVTVFGANGRVGRQVVTQLLERGVTVIAATHGDYSLPDHDNLVLIPVDIYDSSLVAQALVGSTAAISALGSWGTKRQDVLTVGTMNIIEAMRLHSIHRFIGLTGAEARLAGDSFGLIHRIMHTALLVMAPKILRDGERCLALLETSELNWTMVRSPIMSTHDSVGLGALGSRRPLPWQRISRTFVARSMVQLLEDEAWAAKAPYIH